MLLFPQRSAPNRDQGDSAGGRDPDAGVFEGASVLVVEDDFIVAFDMQTLLEERGARVLGPASSLEQAREILAGERPTIAILDVNLNGEYVFPLVTELREQHVPFMFATAYADDERLFPEEARTAPRLAKPVLPNVLIGQMLRLLRSGERP